ncbi:MAG: helix-turn-helix domain-containing protein [Candidatus Bathyarchaeia archaeon]|jgi:hypothetical protein
MRRLIIEFSGKELQKVFEKVKSLEMVNILKMAPGDLAAIMKVEFTDPSVKIEELFPAHIGKVEAELLYQEGEIGTYFIKAKTKQKFTEKEQSELGDFPYISTPFEFKDGKVKHIFIGDSKQIKKYLENLEKSPVHYKVISIMDARFPPRSPLARLTAKQREVLLSAYKLGYYDLPRRTGSEELAKKFGLVKSTLVAHRRKAERRLLKEMLSEF